MQYLTSYLKVSKRKRNATKLNPTKFSYLTPDTHGMGVVIGTDRISWKL